MLVYIDESGDLGWKLDQPYRAGGSSRYLTIAFLISPSELVKHPKRLVRDFCRRNRIPSGKELKGKDLNPTLLLDFADQAVKLHTLWPDIRLRAITVRKENVEAHIRTDPNKLYNYMLKLALVEEVEHEPNVTLIPDPRSIKVGSGHSMIDYLQTSL